MSNDMGKIGAMFTLSHAVVCGLLVYPAGAHGGELDSSGDATYVRTIRRVD